MTANKNRLPEYIAGSFAAVVLAGGVAAVAGAAVTAGEIRVEAAQAADNGRIGRVAMLNEQMEDKRTDAMDYMNRAGALLLADGVIYAGVAGWRRTNVQKPKVVTVQYAPAEPIPEQVSVTDNFFDELGRDQARLIQAV